MITVRTQLMCGSPPRGKRLRVCHMKDCCTKPAPVNYWVLADQRGVFVADLPFESRWWLECYSCGYICTCEV